MIVATHSPFATLCSYVFQQLSICIGVTDTLFITHRLHVGAVSIYQYERTTTRKK
jgi:hypothetical protein